MLASKISELKVGGEVLERKHATASGKYVVPNTPSLYDKQVDYLSVLCRLLRGLARLVVDV